MTMKRRAAAIIAGSLAVALVLTACGSDGGSKAKSTDAAKSAGTLTLYNAQHEDLMKLLADDFTAKTGIKVEMRNGDDFELANQIVAEGDRSPADVFATENSPAMTLVANKGDFAKVDAATLANIPTQFSPKSGDWVGFAARSTVLAYNTKKLTEAQLPAGILDLADPKWKGKIGISPSGADFQAIVSAVLSLKGEAATETWLKGLKRNAKIYQGNSTVMKAVNSGDIEAGVIYHYYWFKDQDESGANSNNIKLDYFGHQDPGAFVSVSGAGVLKSSKHQKLAQKFVEYLTSIDGQKVLAESTAMEYSLNPKATPNPKLKPIADLDAPIVDITTLNGAKVISLMQQAGIL